jgi:tetratricopeptide (TPR) repeat protein
MEPINSAMADAVFSATTLDPSRLENLANSAITNGINLYMKEKYDAAIKEFQRSLSLSPNSEYSVKASEYMTNAYLKLDKPDKAIDTLKASLHLNPNRDDIHVKLGNLYFSESRYEEAAREYEKAVAINPSANNRYSLGQAYLYTEQYYEAEIQFTKVQRLNPQKPDGNYGLGLAYSKMGRYEDAINRFEDAVRLDRNFYDAYAEIGYAYADLGQMDKAQEIVDFLESKDESLADTVSRYMAKVDPPKILFAWASGTFPYRRSINTAVSGMDDDLVEANASKIFTMEFQFDKEMDRASVENLLNWRISKAVGRGPGQSYNLGMPVPSTDVRIESVPVSVLYDRESWTATVKFRITQNETADGTIDPSHIEFKCSALDSYSQAMDPDKDQYTGFSGVA